VMRRQLLLHGARVRQQRESIERARRE
jgi:hypothetical protein